MHFSLFYPHLVMLTYFWGESLPGLPIANQSAIARLLDAGVTVGIGPQGTSATSELSSWAVRNLRFDAGWVRLSFLQCLSALC
jgi:hypothetical protein